MQKYDIWQLVLNRVNETGRRLIFANADGKLVVDITVKPLAANRIIDEITEQKWRINDLTAHLNTLTQDIISQEFHMYYK